MIVVDANLLLYAADNLSANNAKARGWWDERLSGSDPVGLCWPVLTAFIRIGTNMRAQRRPLTLKEATDRVQSWLEQPCVRVLVPTDQHWGLFQSMLEKGNATANLVNDAHLAALAMEYNGVLYSADSDFARFPGLKWKNPLG